MSDAVDLFGDPTVVSTVATIAEVVQTLSPLEKTERARHEETIREGIRHAGLVESAARAIVEKRLYRDYGTLTAYVDALAHRLGKSARTVFRSLEAVEIQQDLILPEGVHPGKLTGAVLREIKDVPLAKRGEVLQKAQRIAYSRPEPPPGSAAAKFFVKGRISAADILRAQGKPVPAMPRRAHQEEAVPFPGEETAVAPPRDTESAPIVAAEETPAPAETLTVLSCSLHSKRPIVVRIETEKGAVYLSSLSLTALGLDVHYEAKATFTGLPVPPKRHIDQEGVEE